MNTIFFSAFSFILTISFLVFIHEYGHFWMARRFDVRIEKFSIGFGKSIVKWYGKRDNTEYSLSWIPLGGYVKMYGETPNESDDQQTAADLSFDTVDIHHTKGSFSALPAFKRLLIAFAGPAVNLIFAVLALWVLFMIGVPALKPIIGSVDSNSALAKAGIQTNDRITAVNEHDVDSMSDTMMRLVDALGSHAVPLVATDETGTQKTATLDLSAFEAGNEMLVEKLAGFKWGFYDAIEKLPFTIETVQQDKPADKAGLRTGDTVQRIDGEAIAGWLSFVKIISTSPDKTLVLEILRDGQPQTLNLRVGRHPKETNKGYVGVSHSIDEAAFNAIKTSFSTQKRYGIIKALPKSITANILQGELMLKTLWRLIVGKASVENLGGPLSIADYSGKSLSAGYVTYFHFLASVSLILAVMNLLPIPVLDGGHILMCLIEMIRGKPLSERALDVLMRLGGSVLITFMLFVITLDVWRYLFK